MKIRKVYKMTNKELAIKVVAEDILKSIEEDYQEVESYAEYVQCVYWGDTEEMKEEVLYVLLHDEKTKNIVNDECEIEDGNNFISYRSLMASVRNKVNAYLNG